MSKRLDASRIVNQIVEVGKIIPHPDNPRVHPEEQISQLASSHSEFGQYRSVVLWQRPNGQYIQVAGHGYLEGARREKATSIRADVLPEDTDPAAIKAIMVADNLHAQNSSDDETMLAELLSEQLNAGFDLAALGTDEETLRQMLEALGDEMLGGGDGEGEDDNFEAEPDEEQTRVKVGDVWQLGQHKIFCGDSLVLSNIQKLVNGATVDILHADPPYGIDLLKKRGSLGKSKAYNPIHGDDKPFDPSFFLKLAPVSIMWGANHFADKLPPSSFWLVWDKQGGAKDTTFASCELAWCSDNQPARVLTHIWDGFRRDSERGVQRDHPNQKPIAVIEWVLSWLEGETILEPFLGSGSTLLACENAKKICYGSEIDPRYVDVCLRRWEQHTNQTAQLISRIEEVAHA